MRVRMAQISDFTTDWRWLTVLAVVAVVGLVASLYSGRQKPHITRLPSSFFVVRRSAFDFTYRGPSGGNVVRLDQAPPIAPAGMSRISRRLTDPPPAGRARPKRVPPPVAPDPVVAIDLTALESEPLPAPVVDLTLGVIDLRVLEDAAPLPADPWA